MPQRRFKIKAKTLRAAPVGRCIYCGVSGMRLTKEHAIPFGLGGRDIIPDASCEECRKITAKFEEQCLRGFLYDYRSAAGFPTQHKRERRHSIVQLQFDASGFTERIEVNAGHYPRYLLMPMYPAPGLLVGRDRVAKVMFTTWLLAREDDAPRMHRTVIQQRMKLNSFLRMIAKIGYSMAVARLDRSELATYEMLLPRIILTDRKSVV